MDTKTLLLERDQLSLRLEDRRRAVLFEHRRQSEPLQHASIPAWARLAATMVLPKMMGGFWSKAAIAAAPMMIGFLRGSAGSLWSRLGPSENGFSRLFSAVKSLLNRYN